MQKIICTKELLSNNVENKKLHSIYSDIWGSLNAIMVDELVEKNYLDLPVIGFLRIFRYKRIIKIKNGKPNLPINWPKTKQGWVNGTLKKDKFIYINRNWGIKLKWMKPKIKNIMVYQFESSRTNGTKCNTGLFNKIAAHLKANDTNYLKIPFIN